jgi:hypothetical protein
MQSGGKTRALPAFSYPPALMMKRGPGSDWIERLPCLYNKDML